MGDSECYVVFFRQICFRDVAYSLSLYIYIYIYIYIYYAVAIRICNDSGCPRNIRLDSHGSCRPVALVLLEIAFGMECIVRYRTLYDVNDVVDACNYNLNVLLHIRHLLTFAASLVLALTTAGICRLTPPANWSGYRVASRVLSMTSAQVITGRRTDDLLRKLHWLPVPSRLTIKFIVPCFKAYRLRQYLSSLLQPFTTSTANMRHPSIG